ncbi:MAG: NAD-dependent epimerase/dehydratase family protein [Proteobacteria bacterium]|nr:NAD-dependent epimerase/dehydratase family protein [Pseudomonadota bacterium]
MLPLLRQRGHEVLAPRSHEIDLLKEIPERTEHDGLDAVIHAAALYGGMPFDMENQGHVLSTNTRMNLNVFDFCRRVMPGKLVTIGSACAYSGYSDRDLTEHDFFNGRLHETVECHGFTKLWMIPAHRAYKSTFGLNGVHLVPANLYGPHDVYQIARAHVVAALMRKFTDALPTGADVHLMGDGTPVREFLHIGDLAEVIARSVERLTHEDVPINVGTGVGHTIRELADAIAEKVHFRGRVHWDPAQANGTQRKVMDVSRMHRLLGPFEPQSLSEGLDSTLTWYRERKTLADARS